MVSKLKTISAARHARHLKEDGMAESRIAKRLAVSEIRVKEYLEKNGHPADCEVCEGTGINKDRATGVKSPICVL